jgi:hypothetical protein
MLRPLFKLPDFHPVAHTLLAVRFSIQSRLNPTRKSPVYESRHTILCLYPQTIKRRTLVLRSNLWLLLQVFGRRNMMT